MLFGLVVCTLLQQYIVSRMLCLFIQGQENCVLARLCCYHEIRGISLVYNPQLTLQDLTSQNQDIRAEQVVVIETQAIIIQRTPSF